MTFSPVKTHSITRFSNRPEKAQGVHYPDWSGKRSGAEFQEKNGARCWTRTSDLYRVKVAF